jgi:hypothetical protein
MGPAARISVDLRAVDGAVQSGAERCITGVHTLYPGAEVRLGKVVGLLVGATGFGGRGPRYGVGALAWVARLSPASALYEG